MTERTAVRKGGGGYIRGRMPDPPARIGLREDARTGDKERQMRPFPRTDKEINACFDLYRDDRKRRSDDRGPYGRVNVPYWYIASIFSALGASCVFIDCIESNESNAPVGISMLDVLMEPSIHTQMLPGHLLCVALVPILYIVLLGLLSCWKDLIFQNYIPTMILPIIATAISVYSWVELTDMLTNSLGYCSMGNAIPIQSVCGSLILLTAVLNRSSSTKENVGSIPRTRV